MAQLTARDPIQWFYETPMYTSELDDCGLSTCGVKIRVMPHCWFVLMRSYVRVDGAHVLMRDVRYFATWRGGSEESARVVREIKVAGGTLEEMVAAGAAIPLTPDQKALLGGGAGSSLHPAAGGRGPGGGRRDALGGATISSVLPASSAPPTHSTPTAIFGPGFADAESAAVTLAAIAPVGVSTYVTSATRLT